MKEVLAISPSGLILNKDYKVIREYRSFAGGRKLKMTESNQLRSRWIGGVEPHKELLTANGTQILEIECREQPARLLALVNSYRKDSNLQAELREIVRLAHRPGPVLFLGMGASLCSSIPGSALLQTFERLSFSIDAGEWLHYGRRVWDEAALSILLTTSGESAELVELFRDGKNRRMALICNNLASTCWDLATNRLPILAGPEYGNATKTYSNATAAAIILASEIAGHAWQEEALRVADVFATNLDPVFSRREELEQFCSGAANIEIIGRGAGYGAAIMSALCIREMSGQRAAPHTGAGFRHGPNLDVDSSHVGVILALGRTAGLGLKLAEECNRRGGKVILVSADEHTATSKLLPVRLDPVPELWEALTSILVAQALTLGIVEKHGCRLPPRFQYGVMEQ
ncbi:SIS domain-containing protein [Edaphobacter acidisoli]|uniref:SIS domain-containing protein n=1 Tax=Edaphobacter acidisoli TaxID=2040573 RepID=UPI0021E0CD16|nr:SIS domain-containing protein [Edaphobacter acidisoli]